MRCIENSFFITLCSNFLTPYTSMKNLSLIKMHISYCLPFFLLFISIHQVGLYCLALVPHNHLPKTPLGGIHLSETKRRFMEGCLHPANVLMCPHTCITNLPKPREVHPDVGPASVIVGNLVQGNRLGMVSNNMSIESKFFVKFFIDILYLIFFTTKF